MLTTTISKSEYLRRSMAGGAFKYADWHLDTFSVFSLDDDVERNYPFVLKVNEKREYYFIDETTNEVVVIENARYDGRIPFANFNERIDVLPGELNNLDAPLNVPYGNYVYNATVINYAFKGRMPFMVGKINPSAIESAIEKILIDDPTIDAPETADKIYASMLQDFQEASAHLLVYDAIVSPSASPKTITGSPEVRKLRNKLLAENPERLKDPAFIAYVKSEMEKLDREWVDDWGREFLKNNKGAYANVRMMTQGMGGLEDGELVVNSLDEGMDFDKFHIYNNQARSGTINRSRNTELGGVQTKRVLQAMQNANISSTVPDCGINYGVMRTVKPTNAKKFVGFTIVEKGKNVLLHDENIQQYVGQKVYVRTPTICKAPPPDYCAVCSGKKLAEHPHGVAAAATDLSSRNMYLFMKQMHSSATDLLDYDIFDAVVWH